MVVFSLAYVASPYWLPPPYAWMRGLMLAGSVGVGVLWAGAAAGEVAIARGRFDFWALAAAVVIVGGLNALPLTNEVPWKGDEDHHLVTTLGLVRNLAGWPAIVVIGAICGAVCLARKAAGRGGAVVLIGVGFALMMAAGAWMIGTVPANLTRYPYINYWVMAAPALIASVVVRVGPPFEGIWCEALYRVVPFGAAVLLAWLVAVRFGRGSLLVRVLLIAAVSTMPVVYYYTSLLYLEMLAVLLMTVVCMGAERLLTADARELRGEPAWVALILIGFIKETAAPFLIAFVVVRWVVVLIGVRARFPNGRRVWDELIVDFAVLAPLAIWLGYRHLYPATRAMGFHVAQIIEPRLVGSFLRACAGQMGLMLVLSAAGLVFLLRRRAWAVAAFVVTACGGYAAMHLVDEREFVGYSRFTLMFVPMGLMCAGVAVEAISRRGAAAGVLVVVVAVNLWMSPMHLDGSRRAGWGDSARGNVEHSYPYREAMDWLARNARGRRVLAGGMGHAYAFDLYECGGVKVEQAGSEVDDGRMRSAAEEAMSVEAALRYAVEHGFEIVLQRVSGLEPPAVSEGLGFGATMMFRNDSHVLVLYERAAR